MAKALKPLQKRAFLTIKKEFPLAITLHGAHHEQKRVANLGKIYSSGFFRFLDEHHPGATIVLFGSYARGEDIEKSDIDIAIVGSHEKQLSLALFEKMLVRTINIQYFSHWDISKNLKESIINGIVLKGHIEL